MLKIHHQLADLESYITKHSMLNNSVSAVPVGWHIEHCLLVIEAIIEQVGISDPNNYKWQFNKLRLIVFTLNKIPRGKAKAPGIVLPKDYSAESLLEHLQNIKLRVTDLQTMQPKQYFKHPMFGHLHLKATTKFLQIHTLHHMKIMRDVIKTDV